MAIRKLRYEGDEILSKKSREVEKVDERLLDLIAVQVGILKRVIVIDIDDGNGPIVLINPVILETKGSREVEEGCLSFPNKFAKVVRPEEVVAEYTNREGKRVKVKAKELLAQAICHEVDHLEGEVFVDKMIPGTLEIFEQEQ